MKLVLQRVSEAEVQVGGETVGKIGAGVVAFVAVGKGDGLADAEAMAEKTAHLRMFEDENGKMNRSLLETGGQALVISQFTLYGDCSKGRRPGFERAAPPETAEPVYERYVGRLRELGIAAETGRFRKAMRVSLSNEGPVTLICESERDLAN